MPKSHKSKTTWSSSPPSLTNEDIAFRKWASQLDVNSNKNYGHFFCTIHDETEWKKLRQMVQLHRPLPTPLHPRAVLPGQPHSIPPPKSRHCHKQRWLRWHPASDQVLARAFPQPDGDTVTSLLPKDQAEADDYVVRHTICLPGDRVCRWSGPRHPYPWLLRASRGLWGTGKWWDPRQRWFPLAMCLAYQYENSLRKQWKQQQQQSILPPPLLLPRRSLLLERATYLALCKVLRRPIRENVRQVSLLWSLLATQPQFPYGSLAAWDSPQEEWQTLVYDEWLVLWSDEAFALDSTGTSSSSNNLAAAASSNKTRRKRKKKKKTKKMGGQTDGTIDALGTVPEREDAQGVVSEHEGESDVEDNVGPGDANPEPPTVIHHDNSGIHSVDHGDDSANDDSFQVVERNKRSKNPTRQQPVKLLFRKPPQKPRPLPKAEIPEAAVPATLHQSQSLKPQHGLPEQSKEPQWPRHDLQQPEPFQPYQTSYVEAYSPPVQIPNYSHIYSLQSLPPNHDPAATIRTSNMAAMYHDETTFDDAKTEYDPTQPQYSPWGMPSFPTFGQFPNAIPSNRNESILSGLFGDQRRNEADMSVLSTAASIASSSSDKISDDAMPEVEPNAPLVISPTGGVDPAHEDAGDNEEPIENVADEELEHISGSVSIGSPSPPSTPSPTLSPVFVSLSEISTMKDSIDRLNLPQAPTIASESDLRLTYSMNTGSPQRLAATSKSRNNSPRSEQALHTATTSHSLSRSETKSLHIRDDQEIKPKGNSRNNNNFLDSYKNRIKAGARDDHDITLRGNYAPKRLSSYRNSVGRSQSISVRRSPRHFFGESASLNPKNVGLSTSRSETAMDVDDYQESWHDTATSKGEDGDHLTVHTVGSSHQFEVMATMEPETSLREEKNMYQDLCLTLGAEVAKLRTMLAAQNALCTAPSEPVGYPRTDYFGGPHIGRQMFPSFPFAPRPRTLAAMSDAGYHDSLAGEDDIASSRTKLATQKNGHFPSGVTLAESDASLDQSSTHNLQPQLTNGGPTKEFVDLCSSSHQAVSSRLGQDIFQLMKLVENQVKKMAPKRQAAVARLTRLVKTLWPRAQVNLYGSHATGLSVGGSDLDFVIGLPAVHKKAVAVAPGALEGRNAINETSQKQLARHLKGESWIDPRSMKLIDRTFVPVIKVSTKDTKAKTLHLDISFEAPGHHGLEAARMISSVIDEFPVVRPLVVVLKLLLIDRSLLESYSGKNACVAYLDAWY